MTSTELVVAKQTGAAVAGALSSLLASYRESRAVVRNHAAQVRLTSELALAELRVHAVGRLSRANIEEIAETMRLIENRALNGAALEMAMAHLELLSRKLRANLDAF